MHCAVACDMLAKLLLGTTALAALAWAALHRPDGLVAVWRSAGTHVAGTATGAVHSHVRRGLVPAAGWMPFQSDVGGGGKTRAAFVVLAGPGDWAERGLALMLQSLHINVLAANPRPVLLFFADDVPPERSTQEALDKICPPAIRHLVEVHYIAFALPEDMRLVALHDIVNFYLYPGYQLMCRWNFLGIMQHPRVRNLDYYCRLDTDSRIIQPVPLDIFDYMAEKRLHYGYILTSWEAPRLSVGLWDFAADWMLTHMSNAAQLQAEENGFWKQWETARDRGFRMTWNEIEILHIPRFLQQDMLDFATAIDATHHILDRRWGDSPLRYVQTMLFLNNTAETRQLDFIQYFHDKGNRWNESASGPTTDEAELL